jgi:hypothetical protein
MKYLIDKSLDDLFKENPKILTLRINSLMEIVKDYHSWRKTKFESDAVGTTNIEERIKSLKIDNELLRVENGSYPEHCRFFRESYCKLI